MNGIVGKLIKHAKVVSNDHRGKIVIENQNNLKISLDRDLTALFGLDSKTEKHELKRETVINGFSTFNNYIINCDLLNKMENFFNEKP